MIKELTYLSPAEILLIEDPSVKVHKLVRVTFFDLLLREVLTIDTHKKSTVYEKKNPGVSIGKYFNEYKPLKHESIFLRVFRKEAELKIILPNLLKAAFENIKSADTYKLKYIYSRSRMKPYFKSSFIQRLLGIRVLSEEGLRVQEEIMRELRHIKNEIANKSLTVSDSLLALNENILLIPKIPTEVFKVLIEKRSIQTKENPKVLWAYLDYSSLYIRNSVNTQFNLIAVNEADIMPMIKSIDGLDSSEGNTGCSGCGGAGCGSSGCGGCGG